MKLLVYGAGVIGCFYAARFSEAGHDIAIYARGKRYESLSQHGLLYSMKAPDEMKQLHLQFYKHIKQADSRWQ